MTSSSQRRDRHGQLLVMMSKILTGQQTAAQQQFDIMNCPLFILVALAILSCVVTPQCLNENCNSEATLSPEVEEAVTSIDAYLRKKYWFYLRAAEIIQQTDIELPNQIILFFIYRNVVGTFQCVASWQKQTKEETIRNIVRLGNGYISDVVPEDLIQVRPQIISIHLSPGEQLVNRTPAGIFEVVGVSLSEEELKPAITEGQSKIPIIDSHFQNKYGEYLSGSSIVTQQLILTTMRMYFLLTYINIKGLFLTIGSIDDEDSIDLNTFVRLGAGSASPVPQPISLEPKVIQLQ